MSRTAVGAGIGWAALVLMVGMAGFGTPIQAAEPGFAGLIHEHCAEEGSGRRDCIKVAPRCHAQDVPCNLDELESVLGRPALSDSERYAALIARGAYLAEVPRTQAAIADFDAARALLPDLNGPLMIKARVLATAGDHHAALPLLDEAQRREPAVPAILESRAVSLQALGRTEEAITDLTSAIDVMVKAARVADAADVSLTALYQLRAHALRVAGRAEAADADEQRAGSLVQRSN